MKPILRIFLAALVAALSACSDSSGPQVPPVDEIRLAEIEIDGRTIQYAVGGRGGPTIVLESGLGSELAVWERVGEDLAQMSTVFAYDRPGYGGSDPTSASRDAAQVATELRRLLQAVDAPLPYVLVGHSSGWQYVEYFARAFPSEVAGIVGVDGRAADFSLQCLTAGLERCTIDPSEVPEPLRSEVVAEGVTRTQLLTVGDFPDLPLLIFAHGLKDPANPEWETLWAAAQENLSGLSPRGRLVIAPNSGHFIQLDEPTLVVEGIFEVISEGR